MSSSVTFYCQWRLSSILATSKTAICIFIYITTYTCLLTKVKNTATAQLHARGHLILNLGYGSILIVEDPTVTILF